MLTPARALVAYATCEDVFTPDGDAVTIAGIQAGHLGSDGTGKAVYFAEVAGGGHTGELIPLRDLTAREKVTSSSDRGRWRPAVMPARWADMTEEDWAAVDARSRRDRARQGLPEKLPASAIARVAEVFAAAGIEIRRNPITGDVEVRGGK